MVGWMGCWFKSSDPATGEPVRRRRCQDPGERGSGGRGKGGLPGLGVVAFMI